MKSIFSITIGLFCIILLTVFSATSIDVHLQIQNAREYHGAIVQKIQTSNYSQYVIDQCISAASTANYQVQIENLSIYQEYQDYLVTLQYPIKMHLFDKETIGTIEGYAR